VRERVERDVHRLLAGQATGENESAAVDRGGGSRGRSGVRDDVQALLVESPAAGDLGEVPARDDERRGAA
jgi:hypothetical protein